MSELPDLIAVVLRPVAMVAVGALVYRASKLVAERHVAARLSFILTSAMFVVELMTISNRNALWVPIAATLAGALVLGAILRKRAIHG